MTEKYECGKTEVSWTFWRLCHKYVNFSIYKFNKEGLAVNEQHTNQSNVHFGIALNKSRVLSVSKSNSIYKNGNKTHCWSQENLKLQFGIFLVMEEFFVWLRSDTRNVTSCWLRSDTSSKLSCWLRSDTHSKLSCATLKLIFVSVKDNKLTSD
jgi:hypothetical protein